MYCTRNIWLLHEDVQISKNKRTLSKGLLNRIRRFVQLNSKTRKIRPKLRYAVGESFGWPDKYQDLELSKRILSPVSAMPPLLI